MELGTGQMTALLRTLFPDVGAASLSGRMKYFHRRGFPSPEMAVGKGWRAVYGADDVLRLIYAFELLAAFVPPAQAVDLVQEGWRDLRNLLCAAWVERRTRTFALPLRVGGVGVTAKWETVGRLEAGSADSLRAWLQGQGAPRSMLVIDAVRVAAALDRAISGVLGDRADLFRQSLDRWSAT